MSKQQSPRNDPDDDAALLEALDIAAAKGLSLREMRQERDVMRYFRPKYSLLRSLVYGDCRFLHQEIRRIRNDDRTRKYAAVHGKQLGLFDDDDDVCFVYAQPRKDLLRPSVIEWTPAMTQQALRAMWQRHIHEVLNAAWLTEEERSYVQAKLQDLLVDILRRMA
jgi:hypothetical protein